MLDVLRVFWERHLAVGLARCGACWSAGSRCSSWRRGRPCRRACSSRCPSWDWSRDSSDNLTQRMCGLRSKRLHCRRRSLRGRRSLRSLCCWCAELAGRCRWSCSLRSRAHRARPQWRSLRARSRPWRHVPLWRCPWRHVSLWSRPWRYVLLWCCPWRNISLGRGLWERPRWCDRAGDSWRDVALGRLCWRWSAWRARGCGGPRPGLSLSVREGGHLWRNAVALGAGSHAGPNVWISELLLQLASALISDPLQVSARPGAGAYV